MLVIRQMQEGDREDILSMMKEFYSSNATFSNGSKEIFEADINACLDDKALLEGYVLNFADKIIGYSMLAKSFSTEFGKICFWIEDLYLKEECRGKGFIQQFIDYIVKKYPDAKFKLEVEQENLHAIHVYNKKGFKSLAYTVFMK